MSQSLKGVSLRGVPRLWRRVTKQSLKIASLLLGAVSQIIFLMVLLKKVSVTYRLSYDVFVYRLETK
jgi:hypothetical protein